MRWLLGLGLAFVVAGFALVFAGSLGQGSVSTGGVVFIGPIPIVFGSGPGGGQLAFLSVVIGAAMLVLLFLWGWRTSSLKGS